MVSDTLPTFATKNYGNEKIFFNWCKVIEDIHRLSKHYSPANNTDVRNEFTGYNTLFLDNIKYCPEVYKIAKNLINEIMVLPF